MKNCTTHILFSLSLVYMVYSVSTSSSEQTRTKRSLLLDNVLHHRHRWQKQAVDKRSAFDTLDLDTLLNDPVLLETDTDDDSDKFDFDKLDFSSYPDYSDLPSLEKDEMSNVIPGAQGPFDFQPIPNGDVTQPPFSYNSVPAYPGSASAHHLTKSLMDEFMQFLFMKEMGMLDRCLETRKRR